MNGRRSHPRFEIRTPADAVLRVLRDVTLECSNNSEITAISRDAGVVGERLTLEIAADGNYAGTDVLVVESRPVVTHGVVRYRLRLLTFTEPLEKAWPGARGKGGAPGDLGVLTKEIAVRVINCSVSGCLIESRTRLDAGTVVALRLSIQDREFTDEVQVVRCHAVEGAGAVYHLGARLLWITPPRQGSVRHFATQHTTAPPMSVQPELR